jgi:RNA polymerase sigma factor (sigma-70 family)
MSSSAAEEFAVHLQSLRRYALQLTRCREQADDLVQETLARAIAAASTLREGAPVRPWLFRILHNTFVSEKRREKLRTVHDVASDEAVAPRQYGQVELRNVLDALAMLPQEQREVLRLVALEEFTYSEAAEILGIPVGTLMSRLARGREALRRLLDKSASPPLYVIGGRDGR